MKSYPIIYILFHIISMGFVISQYKDPYKPISLMECHVKVLNVAHVGPSSWIIFSKSRVGIFIGFGSSYVGLRWLVERYLQILLLQSLAVANLRMQMMMLESMIAAYTMSTMSVDGTRPSEPLPAKQFGNRTVDDVTG